MNKPTPSEITAMRPWNRPGVAEDPYLRKSSIDQHLGHLRVLGQAGPEITPAPWVYSASQLKTYHDCPRKWFLAKVLDYPEPTSEAAERGKALHAQVEAYIKDGTWPESPLAELLLQNLEGIDLAREDLTVEGHVKFMVWPGQPGRPWIQGFLDLTIPGFRPIVWDHKTTADLKWAKSEHELHHDLQMVVYAHWAFARLPDVDEVEVVHGYVTTRGVPERRVVRAVLTRAEVAERWAEIQDLIEEMERVRALGDVRKVQVNLQSCGKFGGCPHSEVCTRAQFGQEVGVFNPPDAALQGQEVPEMTLPVNIADRLAALRAKAQGGAAPEPAKPTPTPTPPAQVEQKLAESVAATAAAENLLALAKKNETTEPAPLPDLAPELQALDLGTRAVRALRTLGVVTLEAFEAMDPGRAAEVEGCGAKVVAELAEAQAALRPRENETVAETSTIEVMKAAAQSVLGAAPVPEEALGEPGREITEVGQTTTSERYTIDQVSQAFGVTVGEDMSLASLADLAKRLGVKITIEMGA